MRMLNFFQNQGLEDPTIVRPGDPDSYSTRYKGLAQDWMDDHDNGPGRAHDAILAAIYPESVARNRSKVLNSQYDAVEMIIGILGDELDQGEVAALRRLKKGDGASIFANYANQVRTKLASRSEGKGSGHTTEN